MSYTPLHRPFILHTPTLSDTLCVCLVQFVCVMHCVHQLQLYIPVPKVTLRHAHCSASWFRRHSVQRVQSHSLQNPSLWSLIQPTSVLYIMVCLMHSVCLMYPICLVQNPLAYTGVLSDTPAGSVPPQFQKLRCGMPMVVWFLYAPLLCYTPSCCIAFVLKHPLPWSYASHSSYTQTCLIQCLSVLNTPCCVVHPFGRIRPKLAYTIPLYLITCPCVLYTSPFVLYISEFVLYPPPPSGVLHTPICLTHLRICLIHLQICLIHLRICLIHLRICLIHLPFCLIHLRICLI